MDVKWLGFDCGTLCGVLDCRLIYWVCIDVGVTYPGTTGMVDSDSFEVLPMPVMLSKQRSVELV